MSALVTTRAFIWFWRETYINHLQSHDFSDSAFLLFAQFNRLPCYGVTHRATMAPFWGRIELFTHAPHGPSGED